MQTILFDVDDTIVDSSRAIISLLSSIHNFPTPPLSSLRDWGYRSIIRNPTTTPDTLFESDDFFSLLTIRPEFLSIYNNPQIRSHYNFILATKGTPTNLSKKFHFLDSHLNLTANSIPYIALSPSTPKSVISIPSGIQIDDNQYELTTNAPIKILIKNHLETDYNFAPPPNTYIINNLSELEEILLFNIKHNLLEI